MENISKPQVINMPFCANGDKNIIPSAATGTQLASLEEGFPEITEKPVEEGGIPPERKDFNGAANLNSQFYFAFQNGWWPTFDAEVSTAIGGYPIGAVLWWFPTTGEYANMAVPLKSLVANNTYNFNTNSSYVGVYWQPLYKDPNALPIGTVFMHQSSNAADVPGALPLFTGETISSANTLYPDFYNWVLSHTELQISAADYESAITTYGECPKYVIDDTNKTIRLPKLTNYIKMANITDGITQAADRIPLVDHIHVFGDNTGNNSGSFVASNQRVTAPNPDITEGSGYRGWNGSGGGGSYGGDTDTSTGNMITSIGIEAPAKNATEQGSLQPAHTTLYPWVCAYNAAVSASTAQAAEFQTALTGKADVSLANITSQGTGVIASNASPSLYTQVLTLGASGATYTAPADGYFELSKRSNSARQYIEIFSLVMRVQGHSSDTNQDLSVFLPVKKGMEVTVNYNAGGVTNGFNFVYLEGSKWENQ